MQSLGIKSPKDNKEAHLIRLLRMGLEVLNGEGVKVLRPDAEELLAIRNGSLKYEELIAMSDDLMLKLDAAYETTKLPFKVDQKFASKLMLEVYSKCWESKAIPGNPGT